MGCQARARSVPFQVKYHKNVIDCKYIELAQL